jgi:hypothetical protein
MPDEDLPPSVIDEAVRLTRLARRAQEQPPDGDRADRASGAEPDQYRDERDTLLDSYDYRANVREDDRGATLVCFPAEWLAEDQVDMSAIEDMDRAVERRVEGAGEAGTWEPVSAHNEAIADRVADRYGDPHAATARSFARFMSSHRVRRIGTATGDDILEFVDEFFPRNTWPSDHQQATVMRSLRLTIAVAVEG